MQALAAREEEICYLLAHRLINQEINRERGLGTHRLNTTLLRSWRNSGSLIVGQSRQRRLLALPSSDQRCPRPTSRNGSIVPAVALQFPSGLVLAQKDCYSQITRRDASRPMIGAARLLPS